MVVDASVLSGPDMGRFGFRRIILDKCEPNLGSPVVIGEESIQGPRAPIHLGQHSTRPLTYLQTKPHPFMLSLCHRGLITYELHFQN